MRSVDHPLRRHAVRMQSAADRVGVTALEILSDLFLHPTTPPCPHKSWFLPMLFLIRVSNSQEWRSSGRTLKFLLMRHVAGIRLEETEVLCTKHYIRRYKPDHAVGFKKAENNIMCPFHCLVLPAVLCISKNRYRTYRSWEDRDSNHAQVAELCICLYLQNWAEQFNWMSSWSLIVMPVDRMSKHS